MFLTVLLVFSACDLLINRTKAFEDMQLHLEVIIQSEQSLLSEYSAYIKDPHRFDAETRASLTFVDFTFNHFKNSLKGINSLIEEGEFVTDQKALLEEAYPVYSQFAIEYFEELKGFKSILEEYISSDGKERYDEVRSEYKKLELKSIEFFQVHNDFLDKIIRLEYGTGILKAS